MAKMKLWMCERRFQLPGGPTIPVRFPVEAKTKKAAAKAAPDLSIAAFNHLSNGRFEPAPISEPVVLYPM